MLTEWSIEAFVHMGGYSAFLRLDITTYDCIGYVHHLSGQCHGRLCVCPFLSELNMSSSTFLCSCHWRCVIAAGAMWFLLSSTVVFSGGFIRDFVNGDGACHVVAVDKLDGRLVSPSQRAD